MFKFVLQVLVFITLSTTALSDYVVQVIDIKHQDTQETKTVLHIKGDFDEGISADVQKAINLHGDKIDMVTLNSPGGLGFEGYAVGEILSQNQLPTKVARGTACLSACAIAFIGGTDYDIDNGVLGFHKGHFNGESPFESQEQAFDFGQQAGSFSLYYIIANGFAVDLQFNIDRRSSPENFVAFTSTKDLMKFYAREDNDEIGNYFRVIDTVPLVFNVNDMVIHLTNNPNDQKWELTNVHFRELKESKKDV